MNTNLVFLALILLAFVVLIGLGRYGERRRRHRVLDRLFNVPCAGCKTLLGDGNIEIIRTMNFKAMTPSGADTVTTAYRVRCKNCGHQMVCEEKQ